MKIYIRCSNCGTILLNKHDMIDHRCSSSLRIAMRFLTLLFMIIILFYLYLQMFAPIESVNPVMQSEHYKLEVIK